MEGVQSLLDFLVSVIIFKPTSGSPVNYLECRDISDVFEGNVSAASERQLITSAKSLLNKA